MTATPTPYKGQNIKLPRISKEIDIFYGNYTFPVSPKILKAMQAGGPANISKSQVLQISCMSQQ